MTRPLVADVYEADGVTHVGTLASDTQRSFLKDLSAEGSHALEVKLGHADATMLAPDRLVRFSLNGTARWTGVVEEHDVTYADPSAREAGRVIKVTGRGRLAIFEDSVVYPELGLGRISPQSRAFDWTSSYFDDTSWGNAVQLKQQSNPAAPWAGAPKDWKDPSAWWVGPTNGADPSAWTPAGVPPMIALFRGTYTIAVGEGGEYRFDSSADDQAALYVDANKVGETEQAAGMWGVTHSYPIILDEGTHLVGLKATNFTRPVPATNVFGALLTVFKLLGGGTEQGTVVSRSSSGTKMLIVLPGQPMPGLTPGHILKILIDEAQVRGELAGITLSFTATHDTAGRTWPKQIDVEFPVSTSYGDVIRHLVDEHLVDVEMDPTGLILNAYVAKGTDLSATVAAEYAVNVGKLGFKKQRAQKNVALSMTAEGRWIESKDTASVIAYGRRVSGLSLGSAPSDPAADRQTGAFFADHAYPLEAITDLQLEPATVVPFTDFDVGDIISSTQSDGTLGRFRVAAIRVSEDVAGQPIYTPELVNIPAYPPGVRFFNGFTVVDDNYLGRWVWAQPVFTIAAGSDGQVTEFDMVVEDPSDPLYVFDIYGGWNAAKPQSIITGGFTFDSDNPVLFDWYGVWRVLKSTYNGWGYTFPYGGIYDGASAGPFDVLETTTTDADSDPDWYKVHP